MALQFPAFPNGGFPQGANPLGAFPGVWEVVTPPVVVPSPVWGGGAGQRFGDLTQAHLHRIRVLRDDREIIDFITLLLNSRILR